MLKPVQITMEILTLIILLDRLSPHTMSISYTVVYSSFFGLITIAGSF